MFLLTVNSEAVKCCVSKPPVEIESLAVLHTPNKSKACGHLGSGEVLVEFFEVIDYRLWMYALGGPRTAIVTCTAFSPELSLLVGDF